MPNGINLEMSHDRVRAIVRADEVPPMSAPAAPALHEELPPGSPKTAGRKFAKGNRGRLIRQRQEQARARAEGIATLNPNGAPSWLRPYIEVGAPYIAALLAVLKGRPELHPLAGDTADAHVMYRACLALATQAEDAKARASLMTEARGWLREHRTALATLSALAGGMVPSVEDFAAEVERANRRAEEDGARRRAAATVDANGEGTP